MTIPPAAAAATPPPVPPTAATSKNDAAADASTGFADALHDVAFADATPSSRKAPLRQTPKAPKDRNDQAVAAPVPIPLPNQPPLPPIAIPTGAEASGDLEASEGPNPINVGDNSAAAAPSSLRLAAGASRNPQNNAGKPGLPAAPPELTFAARVQPAGSGAENSGSEKNPSHSQSQAAAPAAAPKKAIESEPRQPASASDSKATAVKTAEPVQTDAPPAANRPIAAFEQNGRLTPPPPAAPSTPSKPVEAAVPVERLTAPVKAPPQPLKDVSIEVSPPGVQKVEVRLVQQSGELRVAVRTADPDLAHGLREGLPDLVGRLQESGSRAEAWRPAAGAIPTAANVAETRNSPGRDHSGDAPSHGSSQQDAEQRQRHPSSRPEWVDELESSLAGTARTQGVLSWHPQSTL